MPAVLVALREAVLSLAEWVVSPAAAAAAAAHPECCLTYGVINSLPQCPAYTICPMIGWNWRRGVHHCRWMGVTCDAGGSVTHL